MRVLLDEQLPLDLAAMLEGHAAATVVGCGWAGVKNGDLLRRMRGEYDALLTMDQGIEFQQNIAALPFGVLLVLAPSHRRVHLQPLVPAILEALPGLRPGNSAASADNAAYQPRRARRAVGCMRLFDTRL